MEQIQTKLNGIYESTEEHRKNSPELEFLEFHDSLVSIQNLIRDIAIKNKISIFGDETGLTSQRQSESKTDKLKVPQIALIHIYKDIQITEENAKEIAAEYGYTSKTSGTGLYHDYLKYCKTSDRIAKPSAETKKTLINKIELFESVVNHLSDKAKNMANDEIKILKTILETEYS